MKKIFSSAGVFQASRVFITVAVLFVVFVAVNIYLKSTYESRVIAKLATQLEAGSLRQAELLILGVNYNETTGDISTTVKFSEFNTVGKKLPSKSFVFSGNVIKLKVMRIDFDNMKDSKYKLLKSKHAYIFRHIVILDDGKMQEYEITEDFSVPEGYGMSNVKSEVQAKIWKDIWKYCLDRKNIEKAVMTDAEIQAPGPIFMPGIFYKVKINESGGFDINSFSKPAVI